MDLKNISYLKDAVLYDFYKLNKISDINFKKNEVHYYLFNYDSSYKILSNKTKYFELLKDTSKNTGTMIICGDCKGMKKLNLTGDLRTYGLEKRNDIRAVNLLESIDSYSFDLYIHDQLYMHIQDMKLPIYEGLAYITYLYLTDQDVQKVTDM